MANQVLHRIGSQLASHCDGDEKSHPCTAEATWYLRGGRRYPVSIYLCDTHADDEVRSHGAVKA